MWKMVASRFHIIAWNLYVNLLLFEGKKLSKFSRLEILQNFSVYYINNQISLKFTVHELSKVF